MYVYKPPNRDPQNQLITKKMAKSKQKLSFGNPSTKDFQVFDYPFYLMNQVEHKYYAVMDHVFRQDDISRPVWRILLLLRHNKSMSVSDIATHTAIMRPTVSRILERMEKNQFVERRTRSGDNRVTDVYLKAKGKNIIDKVVEDVGKQYEWTVNGLSSSELKAFNKVLQHMLDNLKGLPWLE